ncbi:PREDICTED: carboxypeptidase B-like [Ceratosolen solmsi marchali]|uniref:Carboxypeptidase B-like n=1 Tax=Ceratosolen solmsi marchali TaxID=326594 RepID=A0AAJ6VLQ4_9HYME|nr:PREDICTED: carboxypeptidase B-like [Ceratosolen solmsi marchali]
MDFSGLFFLLMITNFAHGSVLERHKVDWDAGDALPKALDIPEETVTYEGAQLWRVLEADEKADYLSYLQERGDLSLWTGNDTAIDVLVLPDVIPRVSRFLRQRHVKYDVIIPDLQQAINSENPIKSQQEIEDLEGRNGHRMDWTSYHRLDDIHGYLDYLANTYSDICSVMTIGKSVEGRPLKVLRISKGVDNAPALWIDGGIHAREWISPAVVTYLIDYLVEHSEQLEADYYILPVVNPDGYEYTFRGDRLWRKNRGNLEKGGSCIGIDLNRNFGYRWGGLGTSKQPCREIYAGTGPFSEPETRAIKNFFETSAANFKAYLTFHSYGQYILYPWGYDRRVPPDYMDLDLVGKRMAEAMRVAGGANSHYIVGNSATTLYAASGGADDWAKAHLKIKYTYTVELRDKGQSGFVLPAKYIKPTAEEALAAVLVMTRTIKSPAA